MLVCCISDLHGQLNFAIPKCDLLIIAGDIVGNHNITPSLGYLNGPFYRFLSDLKEKQNIPVVIIPGNHDFIFQKHPELIPDFPNTTILIDKEVVINGYKIYGSPWQPIFFNWAFNLSDDKLKKKWDLIPDDVDILVTHGPPYGILDLTKEGENVGCKHLANTVVRLKDLKVHVFGHIHHSYGQEVICGKRHINAALCDEDYKLTRYPALVEI